MAHTQDLSAELSEAGWQLAADGTLYRSCKRQWCHHNVYKPATGRTPTYCSESCRQSDYRDRKRRSELDAEARRRFDAVERVVALELALALPKNSRVSTTQRKALGERITRALFLAHRVS
jgi:hypothetical protein